MYETRNNIFFKNSCYSYWNSGCCSVYILAAFICRLFALSGFNRHVCSGDTVFLCPALPFIIIFSSSVIAVFAAVLQRLLKEAIDIKTENDLTV
ncbi:DUF2975 domain-containing protein [Phosphitispora sp. TUW77]|uniref:DUF2975 domain-containing protein n=1 Tax=Phosphitispora sp. TUW77 TaxID=3152361 RepID=UPI003AB8D387